MVEMFGFMQILMVCTAAGMLLSLLFLAPAGAAVGAAHGLLVGVFVGLGEWQAARAEASYGQQSI
jgi:hypothetical protein